MNQRHESNTSAQNGPHRTDGPRRRSSREGSGTPSLGELVRLGDAHLRRLAHAHPVPVLLGALVVGFALARLARAQDR